MSTPKAPTGGLPEKPQKIPKMEVHKAANPITLTRFIMQQRAQFKQASGEFAMLLQSIQLACKVIANAATNAGIANLYGVAGDTNTSGDVQKKLDVLANDVFVNCLRFSEQVYVMCSEEVEDPIVVDEHAGGYAVVFDPLDGSSNIDANVSVGTIFGIYKKSPISSHKTGVKDLLRPGNELLCGGYALYGSATMLVFTTGNGVNGFSLDPTIGEFILTHRDIVMPRKGKVYSINEGNSTNFDEPTKAVVANWKGAGGKARSARYIGSMVGDVHRTLLYGGIFAYPGDKKNPKGKLRLLYECNPIAFIMEQAGGKATTGRQRILDSKRRTANWEAASSDGHRVSPCFACNKQRLSEPNHTDYRLVHRKTGP
eukprot:g72605.t1